MNFAEFKRIFQVNFERLSRNPNAALFEVELDKDALWNLYLDSFPEGTNDTYRQRREYDCSCCKHFIKSIGNAVTIRTDNTVETIWDFQTDDATFQPVIDALSRFVRSHAVSDTFTTGFKKVGTDTNYDRTDGDVKRWHHFYLELPDRFVNKTAKSDAEVKGRFRDTRNVFKRSLDEITEESLLTVLELTYQNSLYKGEEWRGVLNEFLKYKREYDKLTPEGRELYAWAKSVSVGPVVGRIRNHSIGTLLVDITEGTDLDEAVRSYERIVAPTNYKRPKAIFTKRMLEDAQRTVTELGYTESLGRRFAKLDDITINNILFSNRDSVKRVTGSANAFGELVKEVTVDPKRFSRVEEVSIDRFVNDVLPTVREVEVFLEGKHSPNMVSLIAPEVKDSASMFKWGNGFSWAYSGNVTDSVMKERVKAAGGNVEGVLRFSIQWNETDEYDGNDLDAHCVEPRGNEVYFASKVNHRTTAQLDVDIINPTRGMPAVENITWLNRDRMEEGTYRFFVHNYNHRGGRGGFRAEVEFDGQTYSFDYAKEVRYNERVNVAEVTFSRSAGFTIRESLPSNVSSREVWNLRTNQFVPVSVVMSSPNYWDGQDGIGHRHYFFMLNGCVNPERPNGFYNEFLKEDLMRHKRVFEALGGKTAVNDEGDQLSGVGFSSTKRNELLVKVKGQSERTLRVKF